MLPLFLAIPLLVYVAASISVPRTAVKSPAGFFAAFRLVAERPFSNSAIASNFQVATAYPFLTWAVAGTPLVPFLNAMFWGLGIVLFSFALPRLRTLFGTSLSLHSYLGAAYRSKPVQLVTSSMTTLGLLGVALGEVTWGSQAVAAVATDPTMKYIVMVVMMLCVFAYIGYGGQVSSLRTDQLQLLFAYTGILSLLAVLFIRLSREHDKLSTLTRWFAIVGALYPVVIIAVRRGKVLVRTDKINSFSQYTTNASNILMGIVFVVTIAVSLFLLPPRMSPLYWINLQGFGRLGVASMIFLPLTWQFVDMTNWQRLLALRGGQDEEIRAARRGLRLFALESPFTWIMFLMLGSAAADLFPSLRGSSNVLADFPHQLLLSGKGADYWCAVLFLVSILAIMLSTVDSVLMAAMFTFVRDILPAFRLDPIDWVANDQRSKRLLRYARLFGAFWMIIGLTCYMVIDSRGHGGNALIGALFAFYTAQLSMLPLVLGTLFLRKPPPGGMVLPGLIVSGLLGVGLGMYSTFADPDLTWWPVPVCLITGFVMYGIAMLVHRLRLGQTTHII